MPQVLLTHLRGSQSGQSKTIEAGPGTVITFGRDSDGSTVAFDPIQDDLASRRHARIIWDTESPSGFSIEDLESSHGTYVDGRRIQGRTFLRSGQVMEFGRNETERGPSLRFECHSPGGRPSAPPTKMEPVAVRPKTAQPGGSFVRPAAADRRDSDEGGGGGRAPLVVALIVIFGLMGGGYLVWKQKAHAAASTAPLTDLVGHNRNALVEVEGSWKLYDPVTGRQAYHWHVANPYQADGLNGKLKGAERVPVFVKLGDGSIEPVIMLNDERDTNLAMGGSYAGTGFVANRSGFILTSRNLAAPWRENYDWPAPSTPALLVELGRPEITLLQTPPRWVPSRARFVLTKAISLDALEKAEVNGRSTALEGRIDTLSVGFSGSPQQVAATVSSVSETQPIALMKVAQVNALPECPLGSGETDPAIGDRVMVLTWGGQGGRGANARQVTEAPLNVTSPPNPETQAAANCKDCIWLSDGASSVGNMGAPVFDSTGRVVAIFQTEQVEGRIVAFATPIKLAIRMMAPKL